MTFYRSTKFWVMVAFVVLGCIWMSFRFPEPPLFALAIVVFAFLYEPKGMTSTEREEAEESVKKLKADIEKMGTIIREHAKRFRP